MKRYFLTLLSLLLGLPLLAQTKVTGKVTDQTKAPLPNASVLVKGGSHGVVTDFEGNYSIEVKQGDVLEFSFIGFQTQTKKITKTGNKSLVINIVLEEDAQQLDDVVVVGYGSAKKVGSVVGSVSTVSGGKIADRPTPNILDGLQGKVPGLQIYTSSGEPSILSSIRLHGVGSLGAGSTPLFVVDGAPVDGSAMRGLNPADFESVSVLKDASATSIYGSKAANGVIYITTKRGVKGKSTITLSTQYGISNLADRTAFENMMNADELAQFWVETGNRTQAQMDALRQKYPHDTRWDKVYFKENTPTQQIDLSVAGGSDKTRYYLSGGYLNQEGLMYRSGFEKYSFRVNVESRVNNWMKFGSNNSLAYHDYQRNQFGGNSVNGGLSYFAPPFYSPVDEHGNRYDYIPGYNRYHPNYLADKTPSSNSELEIIPSGYIEINPFKNFTYKIQGNIEFSHSYYKYNRMPSYAGNPENGSASRTYGRYLKKTLTNTLEYKFGFDQNHFVVLAGHETTSSNYEMFNASGEKLINDNLLLLRHTIENKKVNEEKYANAWNSIFGRIEYNYNQKYFLDFSLRRDGSSRFGKNNRYGNFWAAGAMWNIKKENFLADNKTFSDLKLKFSLGTSGNSSIDNYHHLSQVSSGKYNSETTYYIESAGNPNLKWEKQTKYTLALTTQFFKKINFNVELYRRITEDMLMSVPTPYTTGFSYIKENVGKLQNQGIDIAFDVDVIKSKKAHFTPYISLNYNQEEILELFQGKDQWIIPNTGVGYAVGHPVTFFYAIRKGVNPQTGNVEWYLPGSNVMQKTTDDSRVTSSFSDELKQSTGIKRYAPFTGGFGFSAGYKGFGLQTDFAFAQGKYLMNNDKFFMENPTKFGSFNQSKTVRNYWKKPGDVTQYPKWGNNFREFDSGLLEDASFLRLKTLTLSYALPSDVVKEIGFFQGIKTYVTGRNLFTWTKYTGLDPEVDSNLTYGRNPNTKQYVFGVEFKF